MTGNIQQELKSDGLERGKALWRSVFGIIKKLDLLYQNGKAIKMLFSYEAYGYRLRLKETLQKLIFLDPLSNARRAEELIWKKAFYEPLFVYKAKGNVDHSNEFISALKMHILSGIGYYQSLLLTIQSEVNDGKSVDIDYLFPIGLHVPFYNICLFEFDFKPSVFQSHKDIAEKIIQKCLIYIGDLFRYLIEFGDIEAKRIAFSYYRTALNMDPCAGLPHNQLGILDIGRCYGLNAVFHYLRCLTSHIPFEGAKGNLLIVFSKNELRYRRIIRERPSRNSLQYPSRFRPQKFRKTIIKFIYLVQQFLKPPDEPKDIALPNIFYEILTELHITFLLTDHLTIDNGNIVETQFSNPESIQKPVYSLEPIDDESSDKLTTSILVRIFLISILTVEYLNRLKEQNKIYKPLSDLNKSQTELNASPIKSTSGQITKQSAKTGEQKQENVEMNEQESKKQTTSEAITMSDNVTNSSDLYNPFVFTLSLGDLLIAHVCKQIMNSSEYILNRANKLKQSDNVSSQVSKQTTNVTSTNNNTANLEDTPNSPAYKHDNDNSHSDVDPEEDNEEEDMNKYSHNNDHTSKNHLEKSNNLHDSSDSTGIDENDDEEEEEDVEYDYVYDRLRYLPRSSDEESDTDIFDLDCGNESDTDFWGSDNSSPLRSQNELSSSDSSNGEIQSYTDKRLKRISKFNTSSSHQKTNPDKSSSTNTDTGSTLKSDLSDGNKDITKTLAPITEEESFVEKKKLDNPSDSRTNKKSNLIKSDEYDRSVVPRVTCYSERKSALNATDSQHVHNILSHSKVLHSQSNSSECNLECEFNLIKHINTFGQLQLLPIVRLFLNWLSVRQFTQLKIEKITNTNDLTSESEIKTHLNNNNNNNNGKNENKSENQLQLQQSQSFEQNFVIRLTTLLNYIYPIIQKLLNELNREKDNKNIIGELSDAFNIDKTNEQLKLNDTNVQITNFTTANGFQILKSMINDTHCLLTQKSNFLSEEEHSLPNDSKSSISMIMCNYPLSEDWLLCGLPSMKSAYEQINFKNSSIKQPLNCLDETLLRCLSITLFGVKLAQLSTDLGIKLDYNPCTLKDDKEVMVDPFGPCFNIYDYSTELSTTNHYDWSSSSYHQRHIRRGRRHYQHFYPPCPMYRHHYYGRSDRSNFSAWTANFQSTRYDHRVRQFRQQINYRGRSSWDYCKHSNSRTNKSIYHQYKLNHRNNHCQQGNEFFDNPKDEAGKRVNKTSKEVNLQKLSEIDSSVKLDSIIDEPHVNSDTKLDINKLNLGNFNENQNESTDDVQSRRVQSMRDMARLRLLNEVDQLTHEFRNQSPRTGVHNNVKKSILRDMNPQISMQEIEQKSAKRNFLSPLLVLDAYCLASHLPVIKQLVNSSCFIVIVPQAVIAHLDYLKKFMATARVAIRYLEQETNGGNRYLRLQKPDEKPTQSIQFHRSRSDGLIDSFNENEDETEVNDSNGNNDCDTKSKISQTVNLRVIRRWLSILDCASYFVQTLKSSNQFPDSQSPQPDKVKQNSQSEQNYDEVDQTTIKSAENNNNNLSSIHICTDNPPYCDLSSKNDQIDSVSLKTAPVTILIGSRNTSPEDTIVPQEFLTLAVNHGVRLELIRDFIQRWKQLKY